jgi:hypothetical protein
VKKTKKIKLKLKYLENVSIQIQIDFDIIRHVANVAARNSKTLVDNDFKKDLKKS